jgi:exonuclease VII small subunit
VGPPDLERPRLGAPSGHTATTPPYPGTSKTPAKRIDRPARPKRIEQRLASISAENQPRQQALERYNEAFERGKLSTERCEQRLTRLQARLDDLRGQEAEVSL